jgi:hypothetical protein
MLKWLVIAVIAVLAACQTAPPAPDDTQAPPQTLISADTTPDLEAQPQSSETPSARRWLDVNLEGVTLGLWMPAGWIAEHVNGLIMTEHPLHIETRTPDQAMMVYIFVPSMRDFEMPNDTSRNLAQAVLTQVIHMPDHIGHNTVVSQPVAFEWSDHEAAYYLLSSPEGMRTMVLAVAVPDTGKLVVCNVSVPESDVDRVAHELPAIFDGLTIDGRVMDVADLESLLNSLRFPSYEVTQDLTLQVTPTSAESVVE